MTETPMRSKRVLLKVLMLIVLVVTLLGSSATAWYTVGPGNVSRNVSQVRHGQTREEVARLLGEPDSKDWLDAESSEPADVYHYGSTRENQSANYVSMCMMVGIVDPPEIFYPGFSLYFDGEGRLHRVTSTSRNVMKMITRNDD